MPITREDRARQNIDKLLTDAGWIVQDKRATNLSAGRGIAVGEFPLKSGHGEADYLLFFDGSPIGVDEAKKEGTTLTGVELQTTKYSEGVPDNLPTPRRPLPFQYQSTGVETRFTNLLEPDASSRRVFSFHRPETLDQWLTQELQHPGSTLRAKLRHLPGLMTEGLRSAQITAIRNLENSLAEGRLHTLTFHHVLELLPGGKSLFDVGAVPLTGDSYTVNAANYNVENFEQLSGPSYREIIDVGNWDGSLVVNVPGESGQPGSSHYSDLLPVWDQTQYFPILYSRDAVEKQAPDRLTLEPAAP
jgi:hypothetical protein